MRKFKLVKLYPNSPPLGTEVNYSETHQIYNYNGGNYYTELPKHQVENLPEFWQEIVEVKKDYEILEFTSDNKIKYTLNTNGKYYDISKDALPFGIEEVDYKNVEITKVKRLSDGAIFSLGDKVQTTNKEFNGIIEEIEIYNNKTIMFHFKWNKDKTTIFIALHLLEHYKEPILTTEDGYECTLDDRVFGVLPKANWQTNYYGEKGVPVFKLFNPEGKRWNLSSEWLWFKTKENAEKYIYDNKPEFSRKQIRSVIDNISSPLQ